MNTDEKKAVRQRIRRAIVDAHTEFTVNSIVSKLYDLCRDAQISSCPFSAEELDTVARFQSLMHTAELRLGQAVMDADDMSEENEKRA